jgi:hypothetical protein
MRIAGSMIGSGLLSIDACDRPRLSMPGPNPRLFEESSMLDVVMVGLALGFFAVTVGYAYACDRL